MNNINQEEEIYIRVWKGYTPKFDLTIPYKGQIVKYFLFDVF